MKIPLAIRNTTRVEPRGSRAPPSLNRVRKYFHSPGTSPGGSESSRQPVIPPAPLTGDVGRDRGDAGRALLFFRAFWKTLSFRPTSVLGRTARTPALPTGSCPSKTQARGPHGLTVGASNACRPRRAARPHWRIKVSASVRATLTSSPHSQRTPASSRISIRPNCPFTGCDPPRQRS